ncbi:hypothetical protein [Mycobacteroides abscessus]|uniref:hypothetical protein n=1 Tax=Mycobacteroides abscessus TaxID=36809 RepID=UPI00188FCA95|nr:hypothetical protein [Mycobacteroides abscessus]
MTSPLLPALTDRSLTVDVALKQPSILRDRIAKLADDQILLPNFFRPFGTQLQGGGLLILPLAMASSTEASTLACAAAAASCRPCAASWRSAATVAASSTSSPAFAAAAATVEGLAGSTPSACAARSLTVSSTRAGSVVSAGRPRVSSSSVDCSSVSVRAMIVSCFGVS